MPSWMHKGTLRIHLKSNGTRTGEPFDFGSIDKSYYRRKGKGQKLCRIARFINPPEPVLQPDRIVLRSNLQDSVDFVLTYAFMENSVSVSGGHFCPNVGKPTIFRISTKFPQSHDFEDEIPDDELKAALKGCRIRTREVLKNDKRKSFKYPYHRKAKFSDWIRTLDVSGPWDERRVSVKSKYAEEKFTGNFKRSSAPYKRFSLYYKTRENALERHRATITLTVN